MKEHQLLKDRKKTKRKASQAEQISPASLVTVSLPSKTPGNEARGQKVLTLESHGAQKVGIGRGNSLKRQLMASTGGCKDEIATVKTTRQRKKAGGSVFIMKIFYFYVNVKMSKNLRCCVCCVNFDRPGYLLIFL